ncbi:hypothetical protein E2C01_012693 [Portunus trituberculatus]|uniref:Uncharacterized protein n=1 Tax=Portunus trituberculatus TaxID=210409 RepID=A0A5B7DEX2_PORTR|nr:hypothetical protein [Portunus trituberculatus]
MRGRRKPCAARSQEDGRHAVSMKIAIKDKEMQHFSSEKEAEDS